MMRRIGIILAGVFAVLILIVVGTVAVVGSMIDRGFVEEQAKSATGRDLKIGGNFKLDIFSTTPSVLVENVAFANASWGSRPEMLKLGKLEAEIELMPILSGDLRVKRFVMEGLDVLGERQADGSANWEFAGAGEAKEPEKTDVSAEPGEVMIPVVNELLIRDVNVTMKDAQTGTEMKATLETMEMTAKDSSSPMSLKVRGTFNGVPFEADGSLGSVDELMGKGGAYPLTLAAKALGAVLSVEGKIAEPREASGLDLAFSVSGDKLEDTVNAAKVLVPALANQAVPAIGPYRVGAKIEGSPQDLKVSNIDFSVGRAEQLLIEAGGEITDAMQAKGLNVNFMVKAPDLKAIVKALKLDVPPLPPIDVKGTASDPDGAYQISNLVLKLGESDLTGTVGVKLGGERPKVMADLSSTLLDLDKLLPKSETAKPAAAKPSAAAPAAGKSDGRVFPADPLPLDALKLADAEVKFKGQKIVMNALPITDVAVDLKLENGKLDVAPFEATVSEGRIVSTVELNGESETPTLAAKLEVQQLDYGKMLDYLGQKGLARGKIDVDTDIKSSGNSVRAIMAGLDGYTRVTSQKGFIDNRLFQFVTADITNIVPMFSQEEHKQMECLVLNLDYKAGMANTKAFVFETGGLSVIGKGDINLGDETMDLAFDPKAKNKSAANLAIPFMLGGTLASPTPTLPAAYIAKKGAKVALGIMTGGMSTLAEMAYDQVAEVDKTDYCALALAGKPLVADADKVEKSEAAPAPDGKTPQKTEQKPASIGGAVQGVGEGIGNAIGGILGK